MHAVIKWENIKQKQYNFEPPCRLHPYRVPKILILSKVNVWASMRSWKREVKLLDLYIILIIVLSLTFLRKNIWNKQFDVCLISTLSYGFQVLCIYTFLRRGILNILKWRIPRKCIEFTLFQLIVAFPFSPETTISSKDLHYII